MYSHAELIAASDADNAESSKEGSPGDTEGVTAKAAVKQPREFPRKYVEWQKALNQSDLGGDIDNET